MQNNRPTPVLVLTPKRTLAAACRRCGDAVTISTAAQKEGYCSPCFADILRKRTGGAA